MQICRLLEYLRVAGVVAGIYLAMKYQAEAALCLVLLLFLTLSSVNHLYSALREGNCSARSFSRPLATLALLGAVLPFMVRALTLYP